MKNKVQSGVLLLVGALLGLGLGYLVFAPANTPTSKSGDKIVAAASAEYTAPLKDEVKKDEVKKDEVKKDAKEKPPERLETNVPEFEAMSIQVDRKDPHVWIGVYFKNAPKKGKEADEARALVNEAYALCKTPGYKQGRPDQDGRLVVQYYVPENDQAFTPEFPITRIQALGDCRYRVFSEWEPDRKALSAFLQQLEQRRETPPRNWKTSYRQDEEQKGALIATLSPE